jgi:hypothetical protein
MQGLNIRLNFPLEQLLFIMGIEAGAWAPAFSTTRLNIGAFGELSSKSLISASGSESGMDDLFF